MAGTKLSGAMLYVGASLECSSAKAPHTGAFWNPMGTREHSHHVGAGVACRVASQYGNDELATGCVVEQVIGAIGTALVRAPGQHDRLT